MNTFKIKTFHYWLHKKKVLEVQRQRRNVLFGRVKMLCWGGRSGAGLWRLGKIFMDWDVKEEDISGEGITNKLGQGVKRGWSTTWEWWETHMGYWCGRSRRWDWKSSQRQTVEAFEEGEDLMWQVKGIIKGIWGRVCSDPCGTGGKRNWLQWGKTGW